MNCDICGETENVTCEVFLKQDEIDRIYHLCPIHVAELYRSCLEDFLEDNEYKVNAYIKRAADKMLSDVISRTKVSNLPLEKDEEGQDVISLESISPDYIRRINVGDE